MTCAYKWQITYYCSIDGPYETPKPNRVCSRYKPDPARCLLFWRQYCEAFGLDPGNPNLKLEMFNEDAAGIVGDWFREQGRDVDAAALVDWLTIPF